MKLNLQLEVDPEKDQLIITGDHQGIYRISDHGVGSVIRDAIRDNMTLEDQAIWKISNPTHYNILFNDAKLRMVDFLRKNNL